MTTAAASHSYGTGAPPSDQRTGEGVAVGLYGAPITFWDNWGLRQHCCSMHGMKVSGGGRGACDPIIIYRTIWMGGGGAMMERNV